jgi:hypothetical protein
MATDATGVPTSLGIPKFDPNADAPSGLGGNAQMDAIDALIVARPKVTYSASVPGSPNDGDEWIFPADTTTGVTWRFRYRAASSSSYKWEFIGGSPQSLFNPADNSTASGSMVDLATVDNLTVARAGQYNINFGAYAYSGAANDNIWQVGLFVGGIQVVVLNDWSSAIQWANTSAMFVNNATVAAGGDVRLKYQSASGRTEHFGNRWLAITPVRVS